MEEKKQYLLKGDISGIQEFIFNVQSKGAAKALKARSYYVQILGFLACKFILKNLPSSEKFYEGGGAFFIEFTSENDEKAFEKVKELQRKLNEFQKEDDLLIRLSIVSIKAEAFSDAWLALRSQSFTDSLNFFDGNTAFFSPFLREGDLERSGKFPQVEEWIQARMGLDSENTVFKALTDIMVKRESIWVRDLDREFVTGDAGFEGSLINKLPLWKNYGELEKYKNYRKCHPGIYPDDTDFKGENIIDFNALGDFADYRTGTNKIGILKLDVDNLGRLFANASKSEAKSYSATFSRFFTKTIYEKLFAVGKFGLNETVENYSSNIYPIFSGGDDCFIVGSWDAILCFTRDLHELFVQDSEIQEISLGDRPVSFSAGIVIVDSSHPVRNFAELAEEALSKAKGVGKDCVSLFGLSFSWSNYKQILMTSFSLAEEMRGNNISRAYLDRIRKSAQGFNALQNRDGAYFDRIYKLKYYLSKNDKKLKRVVDLLFEPYYNALKNRLLQGDKNHQYDVAIYPAIARLTEFLTKTRLKYE